MIDLELLRDNPEIIREEIKKRGMGIDVEGDIRLDEKRRKLIFKVDELRSRKNDASKLYKRGWFWYHGGMPRISRAAHRG